MRIYIHMRRVWGNIRHFESNRSVGTLVQPHIVDHTRLHLDVAAEVPMVAAFKPLAQQASVGVQCCHTADTSDELHYDEAVVAVGSVLMCPGIAYRCSGQSRHYACLVCNFACVHMIACAGNPACTSIPLL